MRLPLVLLVGIVVSGCQCGKETLTWAGPHAVVTPPDTLEFGKVRFGSKVTKPITVFNDGRQELTVQATVDPSTDPSFTFTPDGTLKAQAGETVELPVEYTPSGLGEHRGKIVLDTNSEGPPKFEIPLPGTGVAPRLCIDAADLDFGPVTVGKKKSQTAHLKSCGLEALRVDSISAPAPFSIDGTPPALPQTLQPGAELAVQLAFSPAVTGAVA